MALIMLINNKGNSTSLEKSMEMYSVISGAIGIHLLESFTSEKIKIFNKEEYFNLSNQEIMEICKD